MAKKPEDPAPGSPRDGIVDALMALAGMEPWSGITLPMGG